MAGTANIPGGMFPVDPGFRRTVGPIVLWDMSCADNQTGGVRRNDRHQKLGHRAGARGGAVGLFGEESSRAFLVDGQQAVEAVEPMSSILPFEPDNWTPRYHDYVPGKGTGRDSVWALRLIAEHQHKANEVAHRSTMVIDNAAEADSDRQEWGYLSDLVFVTGKRADVDSPGVSYTDAGFLAMLTSYVNDQDTSQGDDRQKMGFVLGHLHRVALAYSIVKNGGYVTDGIQIGAWNHIVCFAKPAGSQTTPTRAEKDAELVIRGDAKYKFGTSQIGRMVVKDIKADEDDDGEYKLVHYPILLKKAPEDDKLDNAQDTNSNHQQIPKDTPCQEMFGAVKVKKPGTCECHHYDSSYHGPPPGSSSSSSGSSGGSGGGASTPSGGGGSGNGTTAPEGPTKSPTPPNGVPTVDRAKQNPDGSPIPDDAPSGWTSQPSQQVQHGWAPPRSPGYAIRGNIFPSDFGAGWNPVASFSMSKPSGHSRVTLEVVVAISGTLGGSEVIELNAILGQHANNKSGPTAFYRQAFVFRGGKGYTADPTLYTVRFSFPGWDRKASMFTVLLERRNDTTHGTNADEELAVIRTSLISERS